jgi:hypothetical protein
VRRVWLLAVRGRGRDYLILSIHAKMRLFPSFGLLLTMFLALPFPLTTDVQTHTVDDQINGSRRGPSDLPSDRHCGMASRPRGMIGARQVQTHQGHEGMEETFGWPQRQTKEQAERQRGLDGDSGGNRLGASLAGHRCAPGREGLWTDP